MVVVSASKRRRGGGGEEMAHCSKGKEGGCDRNCP